MRKADLQQQGNRTESNNYAVADKLKAWFGYTDNIGEIKTVPLRKATPRIGDRAQKWPRFC